MYCGSCLRDNRVAATLLAQGRDVLLVPLYTPIRTDEAEVNAEQVFYGGVNVYLEQKSALFGKLPRWLRGLLDSPWLLRRVMRFAGDTKPADLGPLTVSMLRGEHGAQRAELGQLIDGLREMRPDVVNLPDLLFLGVARELKAALRVPVVCTLTGEDIFLDAMVEPFRSQAMSLIRERAVEVDAFVAVTRYFAEHSVTRFGLPRDRVHVVPMGIDVADVPAREREPEGVFTIGYFARVCTEKGLWNLCEAFTRLRREGRDCRLRAGGYVGDRAYLERVRAFLSDQGEVDRFEYVGELDRAGKFEFLRSLHVFSVPTVYHEAKGLYVLEALACGVPVVQPRHGSFPELVEATDGGVLYDPGDPAALADSIARLMDAPGERVRLGRGGGEVVRASFNDRIMAEKTWEVYERLVRA